MKDWKLKNVLVSSSPSCYYPFLFRQSTDHLCSSVNRYLLRFLIGWLDQFVRVLFQYVTFALVVLWKLCITSNCFAQFREEPVLLRTKQNTSNSQMKRIIIQCKFFFVFVGRENTSLDLPINLPTNNGLLICSVVQLPLAANNVLPMGKWNQAFLLHAIASNPWVYSLRLDDRMIKQL